jgi:phage terminase large subunit-like protein
MRRRHPIDAYARDVTRGRIPAGKYHRLACARHLRDREAEDSRAFPFRLDLARVERFLRFGERLKHYKGEWAGQFIRWEPHQQFRLGSIVGWVHVETELRRFRHAYNELPRKQGKSLEDAVMALYLTFFDGEPGAEGYCAATKRDQAKIVWSDCRRLVMSSGLRSRISVLTVNLHREETAQKLEPLGADEDSTDGLNPHFISLDELHAYKDRGMIDVLETATGARRQPLVFKITTAGDNPVSPGGQEHDYACQILERTLVDETYFAFIAHADPEDDWTTEATARKANPNYGVSVKPDDLKNKVIKALGMPGAAAAYKQKHLNLWIMASSPWLSLDGWRRGQHTDWTYEDLAGESCYVGVDLAAKNDLMALVALFPPTEHHDTWRTLRWMWTPDETLAERGLRDRAPYPQWVEDGWLRTVPGTRIDHRVIRETLVWLRTHATIVKVGFDPWHADQLVTQLVQDDGFAEDEILEVAQSYQAMSSGCLALEAAVLAGQVDAQDDPLMLYCVGNAVVQRDGKDNIYPVKKKSRGRIDPVIALAIAWNLMLRATSVPPAEDPDLVVVW